MIKNYLKIAWRNLVKQKTLAFVNILGLSIGIACFIMFLFYAVNEFSFDRFHKKGEQLYRVYLWIQAKGDESAHGESYHPMPLGPALKRDLPDVQEYVRFRSGDGETFVKVGPLAGREKVSFADPSFFSVFSFKLIAGSPTAALNDLHNVVVTVSESQKLFGKTDPIGKTIAIKVEDTLQPFVVTGISEDPPSNSSIQFDILGNFNYLSTTPRGAKRMNNWHSYSYQTFVQLKPGSMLPLDKKKLMAFRKKYYPGEEAGSRADGWNGVGPRIYFGLQPIAAMHTDINIFGGAVPVVAPKTIWILMAIASSVLLIACINFTILAIGRSAGRSKEVGVRKVIGGTRKSLVAQFLVEALLLALVAAFFGLLLAKLLLPFFNRLSGRDLMFSFSQFPQMLWLLAGVVLTVGLLSGSYPALVLSGFRPATVLKTKVRLGGANIFTRSLVTLQFVVSAGLMVSTIIIMEQVSYMQSRYPGFNKENVVVVDADGISDTRHLYAEYKQRLSSDPEILGMSGAELGLGADAGSNESMFKYKGRDRGVYEYFVDKDYLQVLGLRLLMGRNFESGVHSDTSTSVIINQTMMQDFGWNPGSAVGQRLKGYFDDENDPRTPVVIGVVKDFNFQSMSEKVQPEMFQQFSSYDPHKFFIRLAPGDPSKAILALQSAWKNIAPDYPFKYGFLDEQLDQFYRSETRWNNIVGWAGGLSMFLACLGLLGLATLAVVNRRKEIGIRKILGASTFKILELLSTEFLKIITFAFVLSVPLVWFFMSRWLQDYAYRISVQWIVFAAVYIVILCAALLTLGIQTLKAAGANPVKSIRVD